MIAYQNYAVFYIIIWDATLKEFTNNKKPYNPSKKL